MKRISFTAAVILFTAAAFAQHTEDIAVKGSELHDFIAKQEYRYPEFQKAKVYFTNSDPGGGKLNYNYFLQTMQFLAGKEDTLVIAEESSIYYVAIGTDTFFYENGFFEQIARGAKSRLAIKRSLKAKGEPQKKGAYGISSATNNILSEGKVRSMATISDLDVNEEYTFIKQTAYYISIGNDPFTELNKKNLSKLFSKKSGAINNFIAERKINLNKEQDILVLFTFIDQII